MRVLNMGSLNLDYVYSVDHIILPDETKATGSRNIYLGGKGMNQSCALAKAGIEVYHGGLIGGDGRAFLDACKEYGIHSKFIRTISVYSITEGGETMRIKAVCELTGLTDRTIRYYIEQELIAPHYTENYLGRKSFDFSVSDVEELQNISVLRKFDFSVEEIRQLLMSPESSQFVIPAVKNRTAQAVTDTARHLQALNSVEYDRVYTVANLAQALSEASAAIPQAAETVHRSIGETILRVLKAVGLFLLVWLPVAQQFFFFCITLVIYSYPVLYPGAMVYMLVSVLPSVLIHFLKKPNVKWQRITRIVLLILCAVSLLLGFFTAGLPAGMMGYSETTDILDYMDVDADCPANRSAFLQSYFPMWPHYFENIPNGEGRIETVYLDAHYHYRYLQLLDYTYDIYAEWPLEAEAFYQEVDRVTQVFREGCGEFVTTVKGNYTCLIFYEGSGTIFTKEPDNYTYYIFAYDETNLRVRYICCASMENGADQPYYLQLDWA